MGKRKLGQSDSDDDTDEDEEERKEKSVVLNGENHSDSSKEVEGSSGSVSGEKQVPCESESGSEGEKDIVLQEIVESNGCAEVVEPVICDKEMSETTSVSFSVSTPEAVAVDETANVLNFGNREACDESLSVDSQTNGNLDSKSSVHEETVVTTNAAELEKPLNFDEFNSAAEMEAAAMFKVMRDTPPIPETLSSEGKDFLRCCFKRNPAERSSAAMLLDHRFLKNSQQLDVPSCNPAFNGTNLTEKPHSPREHSENKCDQLPRFPSTPIAKEKLASESDTGRQSHHETSDLTVASRYSPRSTLEALSSLSPPHTGCNRHYPSPSASTPSNVKHGAKKSSNFR